MKKLWDKPYKVNRFAISVLLVVILSLIVITLTHNSYRPKPITKANKDLSVVNTQKNEFKLYNNKQASYYARTIIARAEEYQKGE